MPTTSQGLYKPDATTGAELGPIFTNIVDSVDDALKARLATYATYAAMTAALPTPADGAMAWTTDYGIAWVYDSAAPGWKVFNTPKFATVAARSAALPTPTLGDTCVTVDYNVSWRFNGTVWRVVGTPEFATTAIRDAVITSPVVNDRALVGSGTSWIEYRHNGTAWKLWNADDVSAWLTPANAYWTIGAKSARVSEGVLTATLSGNRITTASGPAAILTTDPVITINAAISPIAAARGVVLGPVVAAISGGAFGSTLAWYTATNGLGLSFMFITSSGPTLPAGGWFNGSFSWPVS